MGQPKSEDVKNLQVKKQSKKLNQLQMLRKPRLLTNLLLKKANGKVKATDIRHPYWHILFFKYMSYVTGCPTKHAPLCFVKFLGFNSNVPFCPRYYKKSDKESKLKLTK